MSPGFGARRRGPLWRWTATGGGTRHGWALTAVWAARAGWRAHRTLLGLPRIVANQVPQP